MLARSNGAGQLLGKVLGMVHFPVRNPLKNNRIRYHVGSRAIRLRFDLVSGAPAEKLDKLVELTERYCVVYRTLCGGVPVAVERSVAAGRASAST